MPILDLSDEKSNSSGTFYRSIPGMRNLGVPFDASVFVVEPGCCSREDRHEVAELWILTQGEGVLYYDDKEYYVCAPCALMFASNKSHKIMNRGNNRILISSIWWKAS